MVEDIQLTTGRRTMPARIFSIQNANDLQIIQPQENYTQLARRENIHGEVPSNGSPENEEKSMTYFSYHIYIMNILGMSPVCSSNTSTSLWKWAHVLAISIISIIQALGKIKYYSDPESASVNYCISLGYHVIRACVRVGFFTAICFQRKRLVGLLKTLHEIPSVFGNCFSSTKVKVTTICIAAITVVRNIAQQTQYKDALSTWNLQETLLIRSYELARIYIVWGKIIENGTDRTDGYIHANYGQDISPLTVLCGTTQFIIEVIGSTYEFLAQDIMLTVSLTLFVLTNSFNENLWLININERIDNVPQLPSKLWKKFKFLKLVSQEFNDLFDWLFNCLHANSFMTGSYFLYEITHGTYSDGEIVYFACDVIKIIVTYKVLAKSSAANGRFYRWIQETYAGFSTVKAQEGNYVFVPNLLLELGTSPIGIQSSSFTVDSGFNVQFLGTVVHYFLLLVTASNENKGIER